MQWALDLEEPQINKQKFASDIFAFSNDVFNPIIEMSDFVTKYKEILGKVSISSPANFHPIMKLIIEYASFEELSYDCRNYFNLIYITPGVSDDYSKTFNYLNEARDLPMSVTVIKVKNQQLTESDDFMLMQMELEGTFQKWERKYLSVAHWEDFENKQGKFRDELSKRTAIHIQNYLEAKNIFAYDLDDNDYANQKAIEFKLKSELNGKDSKIQEALAKRHTLVGIKRFSSEVQKAGSKLEKSKDEVKDQSELKSNGDHQSKISSRSRSQDKNEKNWFTNNRKLEYSEIHKKRFIESIVCKGDQENSVEKFIRIKEYLEENPSFDLHPDFDSI